MHNPSRLVFQNRFERGVPHAQTPSESEETAHVQRETVLSDSRARLSALREEVVAGKSYKELKDMEWERIKREGGDETRQRFARRFDLDPDTVSWDEIHDSWIQHERLVSARLFRLNDDSGWDLINERFRSAMYSGRGGVNVNPFWGTRENRVPGIEEGPFAGL